MAYIQGGATQANTYTNVPNEVFGIAINWFAPRNPLLFRLPKLPDGNNAFQMVGYQYRPRTLTVNGAITSGVTTLVVTGNTAVMKGDVFKTATNEYIQVTADPNADGVTLTVRRGVGGSTAATIADASTLLLVGNTRTGAEDSPTAITNGFTSVTQYMQTIQHPYSVAGSVNATTSFPTLPGTGTPLASYKMVAMQNAADDMEMSAYLGIAEGSASNSNPKMGGFRTLISTNKVTSPTNASAYKATDFQRDFLTAPRKTGGAPSIVVVSSNYMDAFSAWGQPLQRLDAGSTKFGVPIAYYSAPFLGDVTIIESSLLPNFTGFALTEQEARWRVKRPLTDEPYGKSGDTNKGHMIGELAIELDNEAHHSWVEGVTAFSA